MTINVKAESPPINGRPFRVNPVVKEQLQEQINSKKESILKKGVIQPSSSPFSIPAFLVPMKGNK
jgi:hypothetical protein